MRWSNAGARIARKLRLTQVRPWLRDRAIERAGLDWRLKSGLSIEIRNFADWVVYSDIFCDNEYDLAIDRALAGAPAHRKLEILDLGANVGFFAFRCADRILHARPQQPYRMTMVEGSPGVGKELARRVAANELLAPHARVCLGLVGQREGRGTISELGFHAMSSVVHGGGRSHECPYVDVEKLMDDAAEIDLVKCDIEGSEEAFIESYGALLGKARMVVIELHHELCDVPRCRTLLREAGLTAHEVTRTGENISVEVFSR